MNEEDIKEEQVIPYLKSWLEKAQANYEELEGMEKAQAWTLINELKTCIGRINFCEKHGLFEESRVLEMPTPSPGVFPDYRVVCDNETGNKEFWTEVDTSFMLGSGDIAIIK